MAVHTVGYSFKTDAGTVPISGNTYITEGENNQLFSVPAGAVNTAKTMEFKYTKVANYVLTVGSQTAAQVASGTFSEATAGSITVDVNSTTTPAPTITVQAKAPHAYAPNLPNSSNEFTADSTTWYLSNPGASDLVLFVSIGLNS